MPAERFSPNSVEGILVFLILQLHFPPFLTTAPQFYSEEPFSHCLGFGCPPLVYSWEHDPSQTNRSCSSETVDLGPEWYYNRKHLELIKPGLYALKSLAFFS